MITDRVKSTILNNSLTEKGEHIVIGLSGGPDSVCLFHILYRLREELDIRLHAVHINHGLRPGAADEDQRYAERLCAEHQVPCHSFSFDVNRIAKEKGLSGEDAGRLVRYESFFDVAGRIAAETGCRVKIAVAQNMNDQAETVLMRILRGTGTDGLCGIEYLRTEKDKGIIIRPLLDVSREAIETYCRENQLEPQIDQTNLEPIYTRNKIRLELLPYLSEQYNPNIIAALNRLSKIAKEDKSYFGQRVDELIALHAVFRGQGRAGFPYSVLAAEPPAIRHRVIMRIFDHIGLEKDITAAHLEQADRLLKEGETSSAADFVSGYVMEISYDTVEFYKKEEKRRFDFEYILNLDGGTDISELNARIGVKILTRHDFENLGWKEHRSGNERNLYRLSYDKIAESGCDPVLRTRRPGDYIVPLGMTGRKKLQDFFVDAKIDRVERDTIPVIVDSAGRIVWVAGHALSDEFKVTDTTRDVVILKRVPV